MDVEAAARDLRTLLGERNANAEKTSINAPIALTATIASIRFENRSAFSSRILLARRASPIGATASSITGRRAARAAVWPVSHAGLQSILENSAFMPVIAGTLPHNFALAALLFE
jgi:hypothetical protein